MASVQFDMDHIEPMSRTVDDHRLHRIVWRLQNKFFTTPLPADPVNDLTHRIFESHDPDGGFI
jgi:hypothetical protein